MNIYMNLSLGNYINLYVIIWVNLYVAKLMQ